MHRRECTHVRLTHTHTTRTNAIANTVRHWYKSNARTLFDSRVEDQSSFVLIEHISRSKVRGGIAVTIVRLGTLHNSLHLRRYLQIYYRSIYMIWSYRSELPSSHDNTPHAVQSDKIIFSLSLSHSLIYSLTHSLIHLLTHSFIYSLTHSLLILFVFGLRNAFVKGVRCDEVYSDDIRGHAPSSVLSERSTRDRENYL